MNHNIPMRNERSTCMLYMPFWCSPMTVENQPTKRPISISTPMPKTQGPYHWLSQPQRPIMNTNSVAEP